MSINSMPKIKIEIEEMKHAIVHHFADYHNELSKLIEDEIQVAIEQLDVRSEVQKAVRSVVHQSIADYFYRGNGYVQVTEAVQKGLENIEISLEEKEK